MRCVVNARKIVVNEKNILFNRNNPRNKTIDYFRWDVIVVFDANNPVNAINEANLDELVRALDENRAATVQAVREALAGMEAGDTGIPAREAIAELRQ
jgi:hypothetical protein